MDRNYALEKAYKEKGFDIVHTGGGCMAYEKRFEDGSYIYVTEEGGCCLPGTFDVEIILGFYNKEGEWLTNCNEDFFNNVDTSFKYLSSPECGTHPNQGDEKVF
jgi:hypothetical protein